jgi:two-component sensor histidine kinase
MAHDSAQYLAQHSGETSFAEYNSSINEIHHRFKNNLQVILSLFSLQADRTTNPQVREMLTEMRNRVRAIAYLHEPRYSTDNLSTVHFGEYLNTFVHELHASFDLGSRVQIQLSLADLALAASDALPLGLICNELVSNAIKYAFPDDRCGNISIALRYASRGTGNDESQFCELQIADDGVGLPQGAEMRDLNIEASPQTYARTGGVLYLIIIVVGLFEEAFVRNRLIVSGDATATATNSAPTVFQGGAALRTVSLHGDNPTNNSSLPDLNESAAGTYSREWRIAASNLTRGSRTADSRSGLLHSRQSSHYDSRDRVNEW